MFTSREWEIMTANRIKETIADSTAIRSGKLSEVLKDHVRQRVHIFFLFAFFAKILNERYQQLSSRKIGYRDMLQVKATHQIGTGVRRNTPSVDIFDENDANVINRFATNFRKLDAAHFCNLGILAPFRAQVAALGPTDVQGWIVKWLDNLEATAKSTRQLPQRVNIGPDRIVDMLHGDLVFDFLENNCAIISTQHFNRYQIDGSSKLQLYRGKLKKEGKLGLVACVDQYLAIIQSSHEMKKIQDALTDSLRFECEAYSLPVHNYIA